MIKLDGTKYEGGGQIVRTALALSCALQEGFIIENIRQGRKQPGLKAQHVTCIKALQEFTDADVEGGELGSERLRFIPRHWKPKTLEIDIGTAGSISLLLQSLLLPCMLGKKTITLTIKGGTDGKWAMPADYLANVLLPHLQKYAKIEYSLQKRGYYPKGGGEIQLKIKPLFTKETAKDAKKINITERKNILQIKGISHAAKSLEAKQVAERQATAAKIELQNLKVPVQITSQYSDSLSPGSGIVLWAICGGEETDPENPIIIGGDALGERGKKAEQVGIEAAKNLKQELEAPTDSKLADNLIPFLAIYGGEFITNNITAHTKANIYTVEHFLGKIIKTENNKIMRV